MANSTQVYLFFAEPIIIYNLIVLIYFESISIPCDVYLKFISMHLFVGKVQAAS
jgi:hypothetical protein